VELPGVGTQDGQRYYLRSGQSAEHAVDTHVFRVSARIGLTINAKTPLATEKQLLELIPRDLVHVAHHWLICMDDISAWPVHPNAKSAG